MPLGPDAPTITAASAQARWQQACRAGTAVANSVRMKTAATKPALHLDQAAIATLADQLPSLHKELGELFAFHETDFAESKAEGLALANNVSQALGDCVLSSDIDAPFWPCSLVGLGADPFAALGIERDAIVKLSGWENPKLNVREVTAVQALANLPEHLFEQQQDYVSEQDAATFTNAGEMLKAHGALQNLQLAFVADSAKLVFTVVAVDSALVGVVSLAVET